MRVCVTGGARGLGWCVVQRLAKKGYAVTIVDKAEPESLPPGCKLVLHDFERLEGMPEVECDVLVLNHATFDGLCPFRCIPPQELARYVNINLVSHLLLIRTASFKKLVFVNSVLAIAPFPEVSLYCSTKAFMRSLLSALRREGVAVQEVFPYKFSTRLFPEVRDFCCMDVDYVAQRVVSLIESKRQRVYIPFIFRAAVLLELLPLCIQDLLVKTVSLLMFRRRMPPGQSACRK